MELLDGLLVIDCSTSMAQRRAAMVLADYHAEVITVEPPDGDPLRESEPLNHAIFNRGKRSVRFDSSERDALMTLLAQADIVLVDESTEDTFGLGGWSELRQQLPHVVISGVSTGGDITDLQGLPPYESLVHAALGIMGEQLGYRSGPIYCAIPFGTTGAAHLSVIGALAGIYRRSNDGRGALVETSLADGVLAYMSMYWTDSDAKPASKGSNAVRSTGAPVSTRIVTGTFVSADDQHLGVSTPARGAFTRLIKVLGLDDQIKPSPHDRELSIELEPHERAILETEVPARLASKTRDEWLPLLIEADVCAIPQLHPGEVFDDAQAIANAMITTVDDATLGRLEQVDAPVNFSGVAKRERPSAPGVPNRSVRDELQAQQGRAQFMAESAPAASTADDVSPSIDGPSRGGGLLDGVKILDAGAYIAGPYSSRLMAALGAQVIKVEPPQGDPLRGIPRMFRAGQAGKRSLAIDLRAPEGKQIMDELLSDADIVHHNMRARVAAELGLDADSVQQRFPSVIVGVAPGWATTGPNADRQSLEPMMSGYVGAAFEVAGRYNPPLYPICNSDMGNGLIGAIGLLIALLERKRTGTARSIDNAHLNASMVHLAHIARHQIEGDVLGANQLDPMQYGLNSVDRLYETSDGWVLIAARRRHELDALSAALGALGADTALCEAVATAPLLVDDDDLSYGIGDVFFAQTTAATLEALRAAGVPAIEPNPVMMGGFLNDAAHKASGRVAEYSDAAEGSIRELGQFLHGDAAMASAYSPAPTIGQHSREILKSLELSDAEIDALIDAKLVVESIPATPAATNGSAANSTAASAANSTAASAANSTAASAAMKEG